MIIGVRTCRLLFWSSVAAGLGSISILHAGERADTSLTVGKIVILGNETTKGQVILREMSLKVGGPFDIVAIEVDQKRIYSLQLFNKVDIDYTVEGSTATVIVRVSERWYIFPLPIVGFRYHDVKKPFYGAALIHQNFRGRNEKVMASAVFGYDGWFTLSYQNPKLTDDDDLFFRGDVGFHHVRNLNVSQGEYDQQVIRANLTLGKRFGLYLILLGDIGYDQWDISDPAPGRTVSAEGKDHFLSLGSSVIYDQRDVREYPLSGSYAAFREQVWSWRIRSERFPVRHRPQGLRTLGQRHFSWWPGVRQFLERWCFSFVSARVFRL